MRATVLAVMQCIVQLPSNEIVMGSNLCWQSNRVRNGTGYVNVWGSVQYGRAYTGGYNFLSVIKIDQSQMSDGTKAYIGKMLLMVKYCSSCLIIAMAFMCHHEQRIQVIP